METSEEALVEVLAEPAQNLLIDCLRVPDLALRLAKLDVRGGYVGELRLVEFVPIFELLLEDGQIGPALLQS